MSQLREKHVGLKTGNPGRFASPSFGEGESIGASRFNPEPLLVRYDLDDQALNLAVEMISSGESTQRIGQSLDLPEPAVADLMDAISGREQITADPLVADEFVSALRSAGVDPCHVERMKRGKLNLLVNGLRIRTELDAEGHPLYLVNGSQIESVGAEDHDAWVTALVETVDSEAIKRNVAPLLAEGTVDLKVNNHNGSAKGSWSNGDHRVSFDVTAQGNIMFDTAMRVEDGHALQKDLGVKSLDQVTPLISKFRTRLSAAHRWALWHPSMDVYRHGARPGLKDAFEYNRLRSEVLVDLSEARAELVETQNGVILMTNAKGYEAEVLVPPMGEPTYFVNDTQVYGLDETKTNQRELAKFLRTNISSLRELETGRRNGLASRKHKP